MSMNCPSCDEEVNDSLDCDECYDEICSHCVKHPLDDDGTEDDDISLCPDCLDDHKRKNPEVYQREIRFSHYLKD